MTMMMMIKKEVILLGVAVNTTATALLRGIDLQRGGRRNVVAMSADTKYSFLDRENLMENKLMMINVKN